MTDAVGDEGKSINFDTQGEEDSEGDSIEDVACVLVTLASPDYVSEHMDATRALDGMQDDEWDGFKARWTYHPDAGMDLTIIDERMP